MGLEWWKWRPCIQGGGLFSKAIYARNERNDWPITKWRPSTAKDRHSHVQSSCTEPIYQPGSAKDFCEKWHHEAENLMMLYGEFWRSLKHNWYSDTTTPERIWINNVIHLSTNHLRKISCILSLSKAAVSIETTKSPSPLKHWTFDVLV